MYFYLWNIEFYSMIISTELSHVLIQDRVFALLVVKFERRFGQKTQRVTENAAEDKIGSTLVEEWFASLIMNSMGIRAQRKTEKGKNPTFITVYQKLSYI